MDVAITVIRCISNLHHIIKTGDKGLQTSNRWSEPNFAVSYTLDCSALTSLYLGIWASRYNKEEEKVEIKQRKL